jgi:hypothetical protein
LGQIHLTAKNVPDITAYYLAETVTGPSHALSHSSTDTNKLHQQMPDVGITVTCLPRHFIAQSIFKGAQTSQRLSRGTELHFYAETLSTI